MFATRIITAILVFNMISIPVSAQFGRLKKILDTAKTLSDINIDEEDERALGETISQNIRDVFGVVQDQDVTRYVTLVGLVVAEKSSRPHLGYQFIVLDSDSVNAFAAPGGFIHITRGALAQMKSEAELAGVLAHEVAHITEKHTIKGIQKMKGFELAEDQTSIAGDTALLQQVADKATEAVFQGFSRKEEMEADQQGVHFASAASYNPDGLMKFLQNLENRYADRKQKAGLFSSHPDLKARIKEIQEEIEDEDLAKEASVTLPERFTSHIEYEPRPVSEAEGSVEGARALAETDSASDEKTDSAAEDKQAATQTEPKKEEEEKKKSGGFLSRLANPLGRGDEQQSAEVTGTAAARGVEPPDTEYGKEKPGNPVLVVVMITPEELQAFKAEGGLA